MSTIIDRINSINQGVQDVKADFKTALENKGVEVPGTLKLKDYPALVQAIKLGIEADLTNLKPENIKAGVTINGITGTYEGGGDSGGDSNIKLVVSNAGSSNVNGVYTQYTGSDYIAYKNESTDIYLWLNPNYLDRASWIFSPSINYPETSGWLYGATDNGSQSPIGLGFYRFGGSGDMPIVELYQDGGGTGGGDTPSVTYLYTVSGASNASANGDYYDTGVSFNGRPTYTNGSYYMFYTTYGMWYISDTNATNSAYPLHTFTSDAETAPIGEWSGNNGATVTKG
jgi:hypothetical protein